MQIINPDTHATYPGEFTPGINEAFTFKQLKDLNDVKSNRSNANLKESTGEYKLEIAAPGLTRDKFVVYANKSHLFVWTTDNNTIKPDKFFRKSINLPKDADTQLAIAEYNNNILEVYIPKAKQAYKTAATRIVVY